MQKRITADESSKIQDSVYFPFYLIYKKRKSFKLYKSTEKQLQKVRLKTKFQVITYVLQIQNSTTEP